MQKWLLLVLLALAVRAGWAHDPLIATFKLKAQLGQGALLEINLPQAGVHRAMVKQHPEVNFDSLDLTVYKEMVVRYLKAHIYMEANGQALVMGHGAIKLGSHQTNLLFYVENYPAQVQRLDLHIDAFAENGNQQSIFWWYTPQESVKVVLATRNNFRATLPQDARPQGPPPAAKANANARQALWLVGTVLLLIGLATYLVLRRKARG